MLKLLMEHEQKSLWDAVSFLTQNNKVEEAKSIMKVIFTETLSVLKGPEIKPFRVEIKEVSPEDIENLKVLTSKMKEYALAGNHLSANQLLVDFVQSLTLNNKEILASILTNRVTIERPKYEGGQSEAEEDTEETEEGYFKAGYAAKRLGVTTQTLRRYCESGRIPGAKKTPGGHWRIPKTAFRVSEEQYEKSKEALKKIDEINRSVGGVEDEFNL